MAFWIILSLILLKTAVLALRQPVLTTTTSQEHGVTLTVRCEVLQSSSVESIEVGKKTESNPNYNYGGSQDVTLAYIGTDNHIRNNVGKNIGVEGHLDSNENAAYLSISVYNVGCSYDGQLYCKVISYLGGQTSYAYSSVKICTPLAVITISTPDASKPLRFVVKCDVSPRDAASIGSLKMIGLTSNISKALATVTKENGTSSKFVDSVVVTGQINNTDLSQSYLEAEFTHGSCSDMGEYHCYLVFTSSPAASSLGPDKVALAKMTTGNICDAKCLSASSSYVSGTTQMSVTCTPHYNYYRERDSLCSIRQIVAWEFSILSLTGEESPVCFFDTYSSVGVNVVTQNYSDRAVSVTQVSDERQRPQAITLSDATCLDAGHTYRCKMVYIDNDFQMKVYVADTTVPPCDSGALMTTNGRSLTCRPDPAIVTSGLRNLEISTITRSRSGRTAQALLNPFLNHGQPADASRGHLGDIRLLGRLDPSDPGSSYLTLTASNSTDQGQAVVTSCMVVYQTPDGTVKKAFADTSFNF